MAGKTFPTLTQLVAVSSALFCGEGVPKWRREKRVEICHGCDKFVWFKNERVGRCGVCSCKISHRGTQLIDLARYEETKRYGCKHPKGSRWKEAGV